MSTIDETLPQTRPEGFWDGVARSYIPGAQLAIPDGVELYEGEADSVDPVTQEVIRYSLMNANLEHSALIQRLCVSPITMLTRDFQTSLLDATGELLFLGPNLQYFSNSQGLAIKYTLEKRGADPGIGAGDIFLSNDVFVGAPHQPDTALVTPIFVDGKIFAWVANTLHYADVGGSMPGSFCVDARDTWDEPLNWPPTKIAEGGKVRPDLIELFARQSRMPLAVHMDLRAALAGLEVTSAKVHALIDRYGADVVRAVMNRTMDASEALFRERLAQVPDGAWSHRTYAEGSVPGDRTVYCYQITLTKRGDTLYVDNRGTDPQAGAINVTYAAFSGAVLAALTQTLVSELSGAYGGAYRCVEFRPEPGLLNCADFPAACSPSGALTTELQLNAAIICVAKMLGCSADEARELALGPCPPHFYGTIQGGADAAGTPFIFPNTNGMMGALGGMPDRDGVDAGGLFWIPDGIANNVEDIEAQYPMLMLYRRLLDGGPDGAGRTRGGLGFVEATTPLNALAYMLVVYQNESFPKSQGLFGANPGTRSSQWLVRGTDVMARYAAGEIPASKDGVSGEEEAVPFKGPAIEVADGDVWEWVSPSTPGWGDPLRREVADVARDVRGRNLSVEAALATFGVVVSQDGEVDADATAARRLEVRRERLGGEPGDEVAPPAGAQRVGDLLHVVDGRWWCNGADLGAVSENYKEKAQRREQPVSDAEGGAWAAEDRDMADRIVLRELLCPVTGYRIDTELARPDDPLLHDILLAG